MPNGEGGEGEQQNGGEGSEFSSNPNPFPGSGPDPLVSIVVSQPEEVANPKAGTPKNPSVERDNKVGIAPLAAAAAAKKGCLSRSESDHEQCRICQQQTEEPLLDLGCRCRGELAKAHRSCIEIWFRTRGSNKCEICQQEAANIPSPDSHPTTNYWVWRVDSAYGGTNIGRGGRERGCFSPLWVAFAILIGGLLLDVLISVTLGVSALPVNIIIGVLIVLGLGTALRLALQCCHDWGGRRPEERTDITMNTGYQPAV